MYRANQVQSPVFRPQQTVAGYYPVQSSSSMTDIMNSMMPLLMMIIMLAMIMPMMKGLAGNANK